MFCGCAARCSAAAAAQQILKIGQNDGLAYRNCVLGVYDAAEFKTVVGFAVALRVAALQSRRSKFGKWVKLKVRLTAIFYSEVFDAAESEIGTYSVIALRYAALHPLRSRFEKLVKMKVWVAKIWCLGFSRAQSSGFTFALRVSLHAQMPMIVY